MSTRRITIKVDLRDPTLVVVDIRHRLTATKPAGTDESGGYTGPIVDFSGLRPLVIGLTATPSVAIKKQLLGRKLRPVTNAGQTPPDDVA